MEITVGLFLFITLMAFCREYIDSALGIWTPVKTYV